MSEKMTAPRLRSLKAKGEKIVCITAYDVFFGRIADEAGTDVVLVGDSLGNVVLGYPTTVFVTLDEILHHVRAVRRGVSRALLVADMPLGSYGGSIAQAVETATALVKAGAEAVKLEGEYSEEIRAITKMGIPVMGHLGMTPQSVNNFGGFKVQGKGSSGEAILQSAKSIEQAGVFSIVLELIPKELSAQITNGVSIPTIGIGAGAECDGQVQVMHDLLGFSDETFRHAKRYMDGQSAVLESMRTYAREVRQGSFPSEENSF